MGNIDVGLLVLRVAKILCLSGILISTEKCPNHAFGEFCDNMKHKSKYRHVFFTHAQLFGVVLCHRITLLYSF